MFVTELNQKKKPKIKSHFTMGNYCIWKVTRRGEVTLFAGVPGKLGNTFGDDPKECLFGSMYGIVIGKDNSIYVSDSTYHVIKRIFEGKVSLFAGSKSGYLDYTELRVAMLLDFHFTGTSMIGTQL